MTEKKTSMEVNNIERLMVEEYRKLNFGEIKIEKNSKNSKTYVVTEERKMFVKGELVSPSGEKEHNIHKKSEVKHG